MDFKNLKADNEAVTRKIRDFDGDSGNIYETLAILSKRANQVSKNMKEELDRKIEEFATKQDNLEEVFENREQIEVSRFFERLPKPTLIAIDEFLNDQIYFRNPSEDEEMI